MMRTRYAAFLVVWASFAGIHDVRAQTADELNLGFELAGGARVADQAARLLVNTDWKGFAHRDRCMAENVDWILAQAPAGARIVLDGVEFLEIRDFLRRSNERPTFGSLDASTTGVRRPSQKRASHETKAFRRRCRSCPGAFRVVLHVEGSPDR